MEVVVGVVVGVVAGFASGIAGIGGGVLMIPPMVLGLHMTQTVAQGTSLLAMVFMSTSGTAVNVGHRRTDLRNGLLLGLGGVVAAQIGKSAALAIDADVLRRLFGVFVLASGLRMGVRAWTARRHQAAEPQADAPE